VQRRPHLSAFAALAGGFLRIRHGWHGRCVPSVLHRRAVLSFVVLSSVPRFASALPDLTAEIYQPMIETGQTVAAGDVAEACAASTDDRTLIRFGVRSHNVGADPIFLGDPGCPDCTTNPGAVCQNPDFICSPAQGHDHPHFLDFARYELLDMAGTPVARGTKASFCLLDSGCLAGGTQTFTDCSYQGISPGCYDDYKPTLGCQYIDATDVLDVTTRAFRLRVTIDPDALLPDADRTNNAVEVTLPGCGDGVVQDGEDCDPGLAGAPCCNAQCRFQPAGRLCRASDGPCLASAVCDGTSADCPVEQPLPDGTACGPNTGPCLLHVCSGGACVTARGTGCLIDGVCYPAGAPDPRNGCQQCDSRRRFDDWSPNRSADMPGIECQVQRVVIAVEGLACPDTLLRTLGTRVVRVRRLSARLPTARPGRARRLESRLARRIASLSQLLDVAGAQGRCATAVATSELQALADQLQAVRSEQAP